MAKQEAIEILEEVKELDDTMYAYNPVYMNALDMAIKALKEIQLYKDNKLCLVPEDVYSRQCSELDAYKEIGTVEECREAAELKHERSQSTEALVYQTPTTVMLICPYCDHENDYEYDDFCSDNGAPPDWDYTKIECEECHRIFQIQGQDWQ